MPPPLAVGGSLGRIGFNVRTKSCVFALMVMAGSAHAHVGHVRFELRVPGPVSVRMPPAPESGGEAGQRAEHEQCDEYSVSHGVVLSATAPERTPGPRFDEIREDVPLPLVECFVHASEERRQLFT